MKTIYKLLQIAVKVCSVVITAPVTVSAAGQMFADVPAAYLLFVKIAAVVVVEATFISSWLALETEKAAPTAVKVRHALTALGLYVGLTGLAIFVHGEGLIVGMLLRFAMLAALLGSIYDSGVATILAGERKADKDVSTTWAVRRTARRLATNDTIQALEFDSKERQARRTVEHEAELKRLALLRGRMLKEASSEDSRLSAQIAPEPEKKPLKHGTPAYPIRAAQNDRVEQQRATKAATLSALYDIVKGNPNVTKTELAGQVGRARNTVAIYLDELAELGKIQPTETTACGYAAPNGNGNGSHGAERY